MKNAQPFGFATAVTKPWIDNEIKFTLNECVPSKFKAKDPFELIILYPIKIKYNPPAYLNIINAVGNEEIIAPPLTTAVPATIKTPKSSPSIIFIVFLTPIEIPIARESVIQRPGVIDITKNTGIKKYNSEKSNNIIDI